MNGHKKKCDKLPISLIERKHLVDIVESQAQLCVNL